METTFTQIAKKVLYDEFVQQMGRVIWDSSNTTLRKWSTWKEATMKLEKIAEKCNPTLQNKNAKWASQHDIIKGRPAPSLRHTHSPPEDRTSCSRQSAAQDRFKSLRYWVGLAYEKSDPVSIPSS